MIIYNINFMKKITLIILLGCLTAYGQGKTKEERQAEIDQRKNTKKEKVDPYADISSYEIQIRDNGIAPLVVMVDSLSALKIYDRSKLAVVKMLDRPDRSIIVDQPGQILRFKTSSGNNQFTCELEFKEGRYRISFSDINVEGTILNSPGSFFNDKGELRNYKFYKDAHARFTRLLNDVHFAIKNSVVNSEITKDGW